MKVGLLGGGGCFALNFAKYLDSIGIDHFGIGRSPPKARAFWQIDHHYRYMQLHLVNQLAAVMAVLDTERPDVIVQFAAQGEGAASFAENAPDFFMTNTVALVRLVLELEKRSYLKRFVQIGSSEVYGSPVLPASESTPLAPTSPYSVSKAAFDQYLESMWRIAKFQMNIIRPSNCYTEGQQLWRVIPSAIICALTGKKLRLHAGGKHEKSYLHADDLSRAIMDVIAEAPLGTIYNVGPDAPITIRSLVEHVAEACGISLGDLAEDAPDRIGQDAKYHLDSSAMKVLGWKQHIMLPEGIARMVEWLICYPELRTMPRHYVHRQ